MPRPGAPARPSPAPGQPLYRGSHSSRSAADARPRPAARTVTTGSAPPRRPAAHASDKLAAGDRHASADRAAAPPSGQARGAANGPPARSRRRKSSRAGLQASGSFVEPPPIDREITVAEGVTVKELSEKLGVKANLVIKKLVEKKIFATINQTLDVKLAEELAREFGASTNQVSYEAGKHPGQSSRPKRPRTWSGALPWSPSWATSITVKLRCSTPFGKPM